MINLLMPDFLESKYHSCVRRENKNLMLHAIDIETFLILDFNF